MNHHHHLFPYSWHFPNGWLMLLAFLIGLALTLLQMIHKVRREVPVYKKPGPLAGAKAGVEKLEGEVKSGLRKAEADVKSGLRKAEADVKSGLRKAEAGARKVGHEVKDELDTIGEELEGKLHRAKGVAETAGAAAAGVVGAGAAKVAAGVHKATEKEPYAGSIRHVVGTDRPAGYDVMGNEATHIYHTADSPFFNKTHEHVVWFTDETSAERAGFRHWHYTKHGSAAKLLADETHTVVVESHLPASDTRPVIVYETSEKVAAAAPVVHETHAVAETKVGETKAGETHEVVEEKPFGIGSLRVKGAGQPPGYTIKGNEDSMLYHSPESPAYAATIAEVWFIDEAAAKRAGFNRWDSGKSTRHHRK